MEDFIDQLVFYCDPDNFLSTRERGLRVHAFLAVLSQEENELDMDSSFAEFYADFSNLHYEEDYDIEDHLRQFCREHQHEIIMYARIPLCLIFLCFLRICVIGRRKENELFLLLNSFLDQRVFIRECAQSFQVTERIAEIVLVQLEKNEAEFSMCRWQDWFREVEKKVREFERH